MYPVNEMRKQERPTQSFKDKVVWITGASSGIGEAMAYAFARQGARLILSSRNKRKLEEVRQNCAPSKSEIRNESGDLQQNSSILPKPVYRCIDRIYSQNYIAELEILSKSSNRHE